MKKVGILTFHRASNYGAILQTYALQQAIMRFGGKPEIIDYRCPAIEKAHNPSVFTKEINPKRLLLLPRRFIKYLKFSDFRKKNLLISEKTNKDNIIERIESYDKIIVGSDQLWNSHNSGLDETYFLPFNTSAKKYTYAVSLGDSYDVNSTKDLLIRYGGDFITISLREESAQNFVSSSTGKNCRIDVDPTFLLKKEEWEKMAEKPLMEEPYILLYTLAKPECLIKKAKELSKRTGLKIIYLNNSFINNSDIKKIRFSAPEEFIGWFLSAKYVCTNSFHGTAFSLIMNKPFFIEKNANHGVNMRCTDLVNRLNLTGRIISRDQDITNIEDIDWENTNRVLSDLIVNSENYIAEILN